MARIVSPIGFITGKLGDLVFKKRGGINYITKAPRPHKPTKDPVVKERRSKFAWVGKFASAVSSIPILKAIWIPESSRSVSPFNKIFKQIYRHIIGAGISGVPNFVPLGSISLNDSAIIFGKKSIIVEIDLPKTAGIDPKVETSVLAAGIMVLTDPLEEQFPNDIFMPVQSAKIPVVLNDTSLFKISLTGLDLIKSSHYRTKKVWLTLVTINASGKPVHYSEIISS